MKSKKIRTQPLCGEFFFCVPYLSFEKEDCGSFFFMILNWMWLGEFSWGRSVYVTLKRERKYGSKLYFHYCNGKWLMDFHGSLLVFSST